MTIDIDGNIAFIDQFLSAPEYDASTTEKMMNTTTFEENRARAVSVVDGGVSDNTTSSRISNGGSMCTKVVDDIEYCCGGIRGKYTGEINDEGKPHGHGSFVRDNSGTPLTYVGVWKDGDRVGNGGYYTNGRLVGNVVWD